MDLIERLDAPGFASYLKRWGMFNKFLSVFMNQCDLSGLDKSGRVRISGHLGKIARIMPGFLWFCPDFCDLVHIQSIIDLCAKRQNNALNVPEIIKRRQNHKTLASPGCLIKIRPDFYKNEPGWRISHTAWAHEFKLLGLATPSVGDIRLGSS